MNSFKKFNYKLKRNHQHFCSPEEQKCCTVPKIFGLGLKTAVLSLKKLKTYSPEPSGLGGPEGSGE